MKQKSIKKSGERVSSKEKQMHQELSHFRTLNMMIFGLMVIVFLSFGTLFCMMYLEVRLMRSQLEGVYESMLTEIELIDEAMLEPATENIFTEPTLLPEDDPSINEIPALVP